jgi:hypothetical protein
MPTPQEREGALFRAAVELPHGATRGAFLDQACAGDSSLRQRLEALLAAHEQPQTLLATLGEPSRPTIKFDGAAAPDEAVGQTLGRYKLLERVGEGGCGVVYVAEQTEPVRRRVALKVIKLGMDTKQVVARFEAERQALAMMDHPNIAKVLDAGTTGPGEPSSSGRQSAHSSLSESQSRPTSAATVGMGRPYEPLWQEYQADLGTLRFSPDGTTLAAGRALFSDRERTVHLWRAPSFPEIEAAGAQENTEIRPQAALSGAVEESGRR